MVQDQVSKTVVVDPALKLQECEWFQRAVASHLNLRLLEINDESLRSASGAVLTCDSVWRKKVRQSGINACLFGAGLRRGQELGVHRVSFTDSSTIPALCRKREIEIRTPGVSTFDCVSPAEEIIALCDGVPFWTIEKRTDSREWKLQAASPELRPTESFFHNLRQEQFISFVVLWSFLKGLTQSDTWCAPQPCASIVIDDPNLHAFTYGSVDYRQLLDVSRETGCHFSIATVPLDLYYTKQKVVELFRANTKNLSLLFHGNDHIKHELGRTNEQDAFRMIAQAVGRVEAFEKRFLLHVSRVMAPPHGAFLDCVAKALDSFGFEAVCSSYGALACYNSEKEIVRSLGASHLETMHNLLILPRFGMNENVEFACFASAFFGRHLIASGHQEDFADRDSIMKFVEAISRYVGSRWARTDDLARRAYRWRRVDDATEIEFAGRSLRFVVPEGIGEIHLKGTRNDVMLNGIPGVAEVSCEHMRIPVRAGDVLEARRMREKSKEPVGIAPRCTTAAAYLRRFATEARARISPYMPL